MTLVFYVFGITGFVGVIGAMAFVGNYLTFKIMDHFHMFDEKPRKPRFYDDWMTRANQQAMTYMQNRIGR